MFFKVLSLFFLFTPLNSTSTSKPSSLSATKNMFSGWADSPPELLLPIFRAATILIGLPLYAGPKLFDFPGDPGPELDHKTRRASIIMKRRLPSVCKSWYQLATPYLYEHITIRRVSSLPGLSTALSRQFTTDSGKSVSSLGCWTKRLDIILEDVPYDNHDGIPEILESLARIIENLPNLNIVVFRTQSLGFNDVHLSSSMIRALAKCGASLQAVNWYTGELQVASDDWITFVQAFPNLRALQLGHGDPRGMYCKPLPNTFTLSSVSTLSVDCKSLQQLQSSLTEKINLFPNVRQLICDYPRWEYQEWVSLLEIYDFVPR
ncbi:hypothetical protein K435DRAFT_417767 [Dendrothele bispora CBS 962.96]|uniref:F-box domain-containing protein n=1 Tax=Dendrothele bispora (strain CBS 962.96) TaxID=1314807 RepID=A0A4S8MWW2_DENBC|nr:hypothetical protein K435DRAFT_417767 [Dendrothele bispora CBS 962.96]